MALCPDKSVKHLRKFGYNVILHPRSSIRPLQLIGERDGARNIIGTIDQLFDAPAVHLLPAINDDDDLANISGKRTDKVGIALGLDILGSVVEALGGEALGVKAAYDNARTVQFSYEGISSETVNIIDLGSLIAAGVPRFDHPIVQLYVHNPGNLYVITETVRATATSVIAYGDDGAKLSVVVPVIQGIGGGSGGLSAGATGDSSVTYKGEVPLAFGFKAYEIEESNQDGVRRLRLAPVKPGNVAFMTNISSSGHRRIAPVLFPSTVIDLAERVLA